MSATLSVITIVRNDQAGLNRTMQSVRTELPFAEHFIVDGSDRPLEILSDAPGIRVLVGRDRGISHAFNHGIMSAAGDFVIFINAGDALVEGAGEVFKRVLDGPPADCHWFSVYREAADGSVTLYRPRLQWLRYAMSAPHQGMMLKRSVFAEIGLFPLQRFAMDHHLAVRLLKRTPEYSIQIHHEIVAYYPVGGHSTQGGYKAFAANCWNVARLDFAHFPLAIVLNTYLALKSAWSKRGKAGS